MVDQQVREQLSGRVPPVFEAEMSRLERAGT